MSPKIYLKIVGIIFAIISLLHLVRIIFSWEAAIAGWTVPLWVSYLAVVVSAYLAAKAFYLRKNM